MQAPEPAGAQPEIEEFGPGMERRYFEFLYAEICVALERRIPRYDLWLLVAESARDPDRLSRAEMQRFLDDDLDPLLDREHPSLAPRARQRLRRRVLAFDPRYPTPEEWLLRLSASSA